MYNPVFLLLLVFTLFALKTHGQELPIGDYTTVNPNCFRVGSHHLYIRKDYSFSVYISSCGRISGGIGSYTCKDGEYIFTFSPSDSMIYWPSSFEVCTDSFSNEGEIRIGVKDMEDEPSVGVSIDLLTDNGVVIKKVFADVGGNAIIKKDYMKGISWIRISYTGYETLEIPIDAVTGNRINVLLNVGDPLRYFGFKIHDFQFTIKRSEQGGLIEEGNTVWYPESKWANEACH